MAGSFFPFTKELAENVNFKNMPPTHRLFFFLLISEFNLRGQFYKSDIEAAVTINTSLDTIRRARRELQKLRWINVRPGFLERGKRAVATTYLHVAFSQVQEGEFFAPIHRYAFESLLYRLRKGIFKHKEILLFFYVNFFDAKYREDEDFFISKRELVDITGMPDAPEAILSLNEEEIFEDETLLEVIDLYHKIKVLKHRHFADPEDDEINRKLAKKYKEDIRQRLEVAKKSQARKRGELQEEDLIPLFKKLYQKTHGKSFMPGYIQEKELSSLAEKYSSDAIAKGIEAYFAAGKVPNSKGAKTRTLANFLECYKNFI